jgi:hypothetical protein
MAINLYLAEKYGKAPLRPSSVADHGYAYQWSLWATTEIEPHLLTLLANKMLPKDQRSDKAVAAATEALKELLKVLDGALAGKQVPARQRLHDRGLERRLGASYFPAQKARFRTTVQRIWARGPAGRSRSRRQGVK